MNNLSAKRSTSNPNLNPPADNSSSPYTPSNKTVAKPSSVISSSTDNWISQFIIFVIVVLIVAAIASKLKHRKGKYKERKDFSDDVKEKRLGKQHHRCADCKSVECS